MERLQSEAKQGIVSLWPQFENQHAGKFFMKLCENLSVQTIFYVFFLIYYPLDLKFFISYTFSTTDDLEWMTWKPFIDK